jgi:hypothetical protein
MKNDVTEQYSSPIISALKPFEPKSYIRFGAELDGLQTDRKGFFGSRFLTYTFGQNTEK